MNLICTLTLVGLLAVVAGAQKPNGHQSAAEISVRPRLDQLCVLHKHAPEVTEKSEIISMIKMLKNTEINIDCPIGVRNAILALEPVIALENVCSEEAADILVDFWQLYGKKKSSGRKHLPKQLRKFFLGFGAQASKLCKKVMLSELEKATQEHGITQKDLDILAVPLRNNLNKIFGSEIRLDNLLAVMKGRKDSGEAAREKVNVAMEPKQKVYFDLMQEKCANKFKPIYDNVIAPVVRLIAIGINYEGDSIERQMSALKQSQLFKDWFAVVLGCEGNSRHRAVVVPKEKLDSKGNTQMITFLDDDDLAELKKNTDLSSFDESAIKVQTIDYKISEPVSVENLVIDQTDAGLIDSISNHKLRMSQVNKFQMRMIKKFPELLKIYADQKAIKFGRSKTGKKLKKFGGSERLFKWLIVLGGQATIGGIITAMVFGIGATSGIATVGIFFIGAIICVIILMFIGSTLYMK